MYKRVTDIVLLPYEGSPFGVHIKYHYGDKPKTTTSSTPISSITIPTSALQRTRPAWISENKRNTLHNQPMRAVFTREQLKIMENEFNKNSFVSREQRAEIARRIGVAERQVRDWFQNRRVKAKRYNEILNHSEVDFEENPVADCTDKLNGNQQIHAPFCSTPKSSYSKENAIKEIVKFLEGYREAEMRASIPICHDNESSCNRKMMCHPLKAALQAKLTEQDMSNTEDLEDALDILKKEVKETCGAHTSQKSQLKRKLTDDYQEVQPPPPKKKKVDLLEKMKFYLKQYH